jgi:hypothetical protein
MSEVVSTEVEHNSCQLGRVTRHMNVGGLDVSVCESDSVNAGQCACHLCASPTDGHESLVGIGEGLHELIERYALSDFHREEEVALVCPGIEHLHNTWQAQRSEPREFSTEAAGVVVVAVWTGLYRDGLPSDVSRKPDITLTTPSDAMLECVCSELCSWVEWSHDFSIRIPMLVLTAMVVN